MNLKLFLLVKCDKDSVSSLQRFIWLNECFHISRKFQYKFHYKFQKAINKYSCDDSIFKNERKTTCLIGIRSTYLLINYRI